MAGMYQRHAEQIGQTSTDIPGIGIVAMDDVRAYAIGAKESQRVWPFPC